MKKQSVSKASCTITSPPVDQKGNTSNSKTAMKKQSVSKASCTITSPPVDQKGDFSQPDGNMAKSLKTESRKLESGVAKKKDNSGLAEKKRKLRSCSTSRGNKKHGEKLRKTDDNCVSYIDSEIFHKMQVGKQIGCIQFTRNNSCGTGFRVGSKYVITAYHVLEDIFRPFWKHVHNVLSVKERKEIKWTKDILPVAGSWNLSKFFSSLDPSKRELLLQAAKEMITDSCHIKMEFTKITGGTFFKFSHDPVAFASKKDDVLILELDDNQTLSAPLRLTEYCIPEAKLHVFGHPDNKILQHDRDCRIIEDRAELAEVVKEGISFFTEKGFDSEVVKEDYSPCKLSRNHILFHCSESIAHGASGAPLVVVTDIARVFGMLQTGHPKLYYNNHCKAKPLDGRPELLLEYGISMKKVKTLLESNSLFQLSNDLFSDESSSQMTQDVETLTLY
ncbi:uncharacterized protein LOC134278408 [Saccostrea cucullata]|uniref:uncharacterized protein LOC134278408 n=1 Tax=Saccostrea cuccullata TaxID=36930 RepID=UPI002ED128B1